MAEQITEQIKEGVSQFKEQEVITQTMSLLTSTEGLMRAGELIGPQGENSMTELGFTHPHFYASSEQGVPISGQLISHVALVVFPHEDRIKNVLKIPPDRVHVEWYTIDQDEPEAEPQRHFVQIYQGGIWIMGDTEAENRKCDWEDLPAQKDPTFQTTLNLASELIGSMDPANRVVSGDSPWDEHSSSNGMNFVTPEERFGSLLGDLTGIPSPRLLEQAEVRENPYAFYEAINTHISSLISIEDELAGYEEKFGFEKRMAMSREVRDKLDTAWNRVLSRVIQDRKAQINLSQLNTQPWLSLMARIQSRGALDKENFQAEVSRFAAKALSEAVQPVRERGFGKPTPPPTFFQTHLLPTFEKLTEEHPDEFIDALFGFGKVTE